MLRKIIFWCHLGVGVAVGAVVLVMSVTGVLLTYQRQITAWADRTALHPSSAGSAVAATRLPIHELVGRAQQGQSGKPTAVKWHADAAQPVEVAFGRERTLFLDPSTGAVLGSGHLGVREFFSKTVSLHRWLGGEGPTRERGKMITGASNLGFLFLVVSGFFLWWPRNWTPRALANVMLFRRGLTPKARDFNWHNVIGFWSLVPLFVIVLSGVVISYTWAGNLVYRAVGEEPPARSGAGNVSARGGGSPAAELTGLANLARLRDVAERQQPGWKSITLQLGPVGSETANFTIDRGTGGEPQKRAQLGVSRETGEVVKWEPFGATSPGRRLRSILRFAHTGEVLGIPGQTVAGVVSLGSVVLVWTGIALALRRFGGWRRRGTARAEPELRPARIRAIQQV